jgi:hypothetical protein
MHSEMKPRETKQNDTTVKNKAKQSWIEKEKENRPIISLFSGLSPGGSKVFRTVYSTLSLLF